MTWRGESRRLPCRTSQRSSSAEDLPDRLESCRSRAGCFQLHSCHSVDSTRQPLDVVAEGHCRLGGGTSPIKRRSSANAVEPSSSESPLCELIKVHRTRSHWTADRE